MIRICSTLSSAGYIIVLVGRTKSNSLVFEKMPFVQKRLPGIFSKGWLFYAEYNIRLFFFLLFKKMDGICAIDLDTIIPCYLISKLKNIKRVYDAHELFCEMKEIVSRPRIYKVWKWIEKNTVPHFKNGYTVSLPIAEEFYKLYACNYEVIRNVALYEPGYREKKEKIIIYQGAVNEGRCFEMLIPAMQWIDAPLYIYGEGNFIEKARQLAIDYDVTNKIHFQGMVTPSELKVYTNKAYIGITLFEREGLSNYYSLANRFFDYIHAGIPQLCMDYPVYRDLNNLHNVAVLIDDLSAANIAENINSILNDTVTWQILHNNCVEAAKTLNWQTEEKKLISIYKKIFG